MSKCFCSPCEEAAVTRHLQGPDRAHAALVVMHHFGNLRVRLIRAKVEQRAPAVTVAEQLEGKPAPHVINIMAALRESMEAKGRGQGARRGAESEWESSQKREPVTRPARPRPSPRRTAH